MLKNYFGHYFFCLPSNESPTYDNLSFYLTKQGWRKTHWEWWAHLNAKNFAFHPRATITLEYKHLLAKLVNQYCPQVMPTTYPLDNHNWSEILSDIGEKYYYQQNQLLDYRENLAWILKPSLLNLSLIHI